MVDYVKYENTSLAYDGWLFYSWDKITLEIRLDGDHITESAHILIKLLLIINWQVLVNKEIFESLKKLKSVLAVLITKVC